MIDRIRHRGLRLFHQQGDGRLLPQTQLARIARILDHLNRAASPQAMDIPGLRLHPLRGDLDGFWAVDVTRNWRIIFRFEDGHATDVDLIDYH